MLKSKLKLIPSKPGCYLFKDKDNIIIYVGKAKNLKNRVKSYFSTKHSGKTKALVSNIEDLEFIITKNEVEALILELNLIKRYNPKYNILFKDDKTYPYIEITKEKYPRLLIVREAVLKKRNSKLFGPYPNVYAAKKTVNLLNRMYPLRKCQYLPKKACLYSHIGECLGYCVNQIDPKVISKIVKEITDFLQGNEDHLIKKIETKMKEASLKLDYEKAQELKLLLDDLNLTLHKQDIDLIDFTDRDVFNYYLLEDYMSVQVFHLRGGKLVERDSNIFPLTLEEETLESYIYSFYERNILPKEILVPSNINIEMLKEALNVKVLTPKRGPKKKILDLAYENAKISLENKIIILKNKETEKLKLEEELKELLGLSKIERIEVFDNAHLFGTSSVSGMIVLEDFLFKKKDYRKFKIKSDYNDDYHYMKEVIYRRYFRLLKENGTFPDLIMVDGGFIQVNAALKSLEVLGLKIPVLGLKKNFHQLTTLVYQKKEISLDKRSSLFLFLTKVNNEVHQYTINYHRLIRSKGTLSSILDNISGIGFIRKKRLLEKYKTITNIKNSSKEELKEILPDKVIANLTKEIKKLEN